MNALDDESDEDGTNLTGLDKELEIVSMLRRYADIHESRVTSARDADVVKEDAEKLRVGLTNFVKKLNKDDDSWRVKEFGKRASDGALKGEKVGKPLKVAACRIDVEEHLKKPMRDATAVHMMTKAKELMDVPNTTAGLCGGMTSDKNAEVRAWMDNEAERNGPLFYAKLITFFVDGYNDFRITYDQWNCAKTALEKAFIYRMHVLFMTPEGVMTREAFKDALDQREKAIGAAEKHAMEHRTRQNDIAQAIHSPEVIAAMLQNPQVQAMIAQMMSARDSDM